MSYSELTQRYFEFPPNVGELAGAADRRRGNAGSPDSGIWVQFDLKVAGGRIEAARFFAFGCPHAIAVASWIAEHAAGLAWPASLPEEVHALQRRFDVPIEKLGRLLVVEDAWIAANRAGVTNSGVRLE